MATLQTTTRRMLSLAVTTWLLTVVVISRQGEAALYDRYMEDHYRSGPWISDRLPRHVHRKIESAVESAAQRLRSHPTCARLFSRLGKNGAEILRQTLYFPADVLMEHRVCVNNYAFTKVGIRPTWICRRMWQLPATSIELVLLHEALHHAGLEEWPQTRTAASHSRDITGRVVAACGY